MNTPLSLRNQWVMDRLAGVCHTMLKDVWRPAIIVTSLYRLYLVNYGPLKRKEVPHINI